MVRLVNRAKMTTATTGTGTITLGTASGGFQTFTGAGVVDGDLVRYVIEEGNAFELGSGVFNATGGTLTRNPSESSAGGGAITLAGSALVFVTAASTDIQQPPAEGPFVDGDKTKLDGIAAGAQVNVATNLGYTSAASAGTITSSTGTNATLPAATTSVAGLLTGADKTKLDGIAAGAQVNVATNLSVTAGTIAGPTINSSTGTNVTFPTASGTASGAVTTGDQTWAGTKTFSSAVVLSTAGTATTHAVRADRTITTGTGILGGGNLTANRTFSIDIASQAESAAGTDNAHVMTPLQVRNALNATGSAPIFACRAFVNFNGTGTVAIRASGNVSSITDNGVGNYRINFATAMPDDSYTPLGCSNGPVSSGGAVAQAHCPTFMDNLAAGGVDMDVFNVQNSAQRADPPLGFVVIFR